MRAAMGITTMRRCDGCGQEASGEHLARRVRRLEWASRFRPVHVSALFLGAAAPAEDADFLYARAREESSSTGDVPFAGEGKRILTAAGLEEMSQEATDNRAPVLAEFQRRGYFLTHLLECPVETGSGAKSSMDDLIAARLPAALARIRRSLKPRRIVAVSRALEKSVPAIAAAAGIEVTAASVFPLDGEEDSFKRLPEKVMRFLLAGTEGR